MCSFADAEGRPSVSTNKNITSYSNFGDKIDGLDIEMKLNRSRINISGNSITDTGRYVTLKSEPHALSVIGNYYVGELICKVNMCITYN